MNKQETKKEEYKLLKEGIFNDAHPFFKGLVVKAEKVGTDYMITVNEGRTWTKLYTNEEACMKVFNRMTKKGGGKNAKDF